MLHITNGDSAAEAIRASGVRGEVLPWRDVLHEGPVPAGLDLEALSAVRARFLSLAGRLPEPAVAADFRRRDLRLQEAAHEDEVVLWFEHDLYDQLQLLQLLDWFVERPVERLSLINPAEYLGAATPARLAALFPGRARVDAAQLEVGRRAWSAFRAPRPERLEQLMNQGVPELPFLEGAARRLLEQLPGAEDGLSRSERQVLEALADEARDAGELFAMHNALEEPVWLGDATFLDYLRGLAAGPHPLVAIGGQDARWQHWRVALTPGGSQVLAGQADAVRLRGVDRWIGGVQLQGRGPVWRWDRVAGRTVER